MGTTGIVNDFWESRQQKPQMVAKAQQVQHTDVHALFDGEPQDDTLDEADIMREQLTAQAQAATADELDGVEQMWSRPSSEADDMVAEASFSVPVDQQHPDIGQQADEVVFDGSLWSRPEGEEHE